MEPYLGRIAFNLAILLVVLAIIPFPFLDTGSAEFVVDILALIISLTFLFIVTWDVRRQVKKEIGTPKEH